MDLVGYNHDGMRWNPMPNLKPRRLIYPTWYMNMMGPEGNHFAEWADTHVDPAFDTLHLAQEGKSTLISTPDHFKSLYAPSMEGASMQSTVADHKTYSLVCFGVVVGAIAGVMIPKMMKKSNRNYENIESSNSAYGAI